MKTPEEWINDHPFWSKEQYKVNKQIRESAC